jgi:hypothetical protein
MSRSLGRGGRALTGGDEMGEKVLPDMCRIVGGASDGGGHTLHE